MRKLNQFHHYELTLRAGPSLAEASVEVTYVGQDGQVLGVAYDLAIAFAYTWKDVAFLIRKGLKDLALDEDPVREVSPMVDLS